MDAHHPTRLASRRVKSVNVDHLKKQRRVLILRLIALQCKLRNLNYVFRHDERSKCTSAPTFFELCKDQSDPDALHQAVHNLANVTAHYKMMLDRAVREARAKEKLLASPTSREVLRQDRYQASPSELRAGAKDAFLPPFREQITQQQEPWFRRVPSTDDRAPWADCPFGDLTRHPVLANGMAHWSRQYGPAARTAVEETCRNAVLQNWNLVVQRGNCERMEVVDGLGAAAWNQERALRFPHKVQVALTQ